MRRRGAGPSFPRLAHCGTSCGILAHVLPAMGLALGVVVAGCSLPDRSDTGEKATTISCVDAQNRYLESTEKYQGYALPRAVSVVPAVEGREYYFIGDVQGSWRALLALALLSGVVQVGGEGAEAEDASVREARALLFHGEQGAMERNFSGQDPGAQGLFDLSRIQVAGNSDGVLVQVGDLLHGGADHHGGADNVMAVRVARRISSLLGAGGEANSGGTAADFGAQSAWRGLRENAARGRSFWLMGNHDYGLMTDPLIKRYPMLGENVCEEHFPHHTEVGSFVRRLLVGVKIGRLWASHTGYIGDRALYEAERGGGCLREGGGQSGAGMNANGARGTPVSSAMGQRSNEGVGDGDGDGLGQSLTAMMRRLHEGFGRLPVPDLFLGMPKASLEQLGYEGYRDEEHYEKSDGHGVLNDSYWWLRTGWQPGGPGEGESGAKGWGASDSGLARLRAYGAALEVDTVVMGHKSRWHPQGRRDSEGKGLSFVDGDALDGMGPPDRFAPDVDAGTRDEAESTGVRLYKTDVGLFGHGKDESTRPIHWMLRCTMESSGHCSDFRRLVFGPDLGPVWEAVTRRDNN